MDILQAVARHARTRKIFVHFAHMTGRAIDFFVAAFEREFCLAVVVGLYARPFCLAMAALAFFAEPALVRVDSFMAIKTKGWRLAENNFGQVAARARDRFVRVLELKVRIAVIESFPVELIDVGVPALMVRVAVPAFLLQRFGI